MGGEVPKEGVCHFNSRPRKEVDISYCPRRAGLLLFQLTTSRGGRLLALCKTPSIQPFQLTTSQGGRRRFHAGRRSGYSYFNSRPRKEVDDIAST